MLLSELICIFKRTYLNLSKNEKGRLRIRIIQAIANNSFVIKGRGGIPLAPESPLSSHNVLIDGNLNSASIPQPIETGKGKIQPARGIKLKADGSVVLTAYQTDSSGARISPPEISCLR